MNHNNEFEAAWARILKRDKEKTLFKGESWIKELCRSVTTDALEMQSIEYGVLYCNKCNELVKTHKR